MIPEHKPVVVAPDAFKGCLSAQEVARALAAGIGRVRPGTEVRLVPVADGGEGSLELVVRAAGGRVEQVEVTGPLGRPVQAGLGLLDGGRTVWIESAQACGLGLVPAGFRDPMRTTSLGVGQLMGIALDRGASHLVVGLGGSATVDGGLGLLAGLGADVIDEKGKAVPPGGRGLVLAAKVDLASLEGRLAGVEIEAAVDVRNALLGEEGAARVFGPQKGAAPRQVEILEAGLARWADVLAEACGARVQGLAGAGAAGGLGAALAALGARLRSGAGLVCDRVGLDRALQGAGLVIAGEGRADGQTRYGKAPAEVAGRALGAGVPAALVAGELGPGAEDLHDLGFGWILDLADLGDLPRTERLRPQVAAGLLSEAAARLVDQVGAG